MRKEGWILIAAALWTLYIWITRIYTIVKQDQTRAFKIAHFVLAGISIAFAFAIGRIGVRLLRRA